MEIKFINYKKLGLLTILFILVCHITFANSLTSQPQVKQFINQVAENYKFNPSYIKSILDRASYNPEVITRIETPYEAKPWYQYRSLFITQDRIDNGIKYWQEQNKLVAWEENEYGIPGSLVLAIIGIESKYGTQMGNFRVLDALTTLAFNYPPQEKLFQSELGSFIAMITIYHINPLTLMGSYAGAMGQCQFMPSSYLHYAVSFQTEKKPDLFYNKSDVIFSIGNYLRQHGWDVNQPIAVPAKLVGNQFYKLVKSSSSPPTEPTMTLSELAKYGVYPIIGGYNQNLLANLISFQGEKGPEYWLTFNNFFVITSYNTSNLYAMAAFQLSLLLQHTWDKQHSVALKKNSKKYPEL